ncbi:hypothetical protein D3C86_2016040 [compost metagenome]
MGLEFFRVGLPDAFEYYATFKVFVFFYCPLFAVGLDPVLVLGHCFVQFAGTIEA